MNFSKILPGLKVLAPNIATMLGGPLAGLAVTELGKMFGIDMTAPDADAALDTAMMAMTPEKAAEVRKNDQDFAVKMKGLDIDIEKINQVDRDSARRLQVETHDWTPRVIAGAVTWGLFALLGLLAFHTIPNGNERILDVMLGSLGTAFSAVVSFYFGSSSSSKTKDAALAAVVATKPS